LISGGNCTIIQPMKNQDDLDILLEPFQIALALEREGKRLFTEAALSTNGTLARQTFEFLSREEDKHIERIEKFYLAVKRSGGQHYPDTEDSTADQRLESFNQMLEDLKDEYRSTSTDIDAYKMALEFETGAEVFYEEKLKESDNPQVKRFYRWLIEEETMHSRLLRSCLRFVQDPAEWFRRRKSAT